MDNLWKQGKGLDLIYQLLRCPAPGCDKGFLMPDADWEPLKPTKPAPAPKVGAVLEYAPGVCL